MPRHWHYVEIKLINTQFCFQKLCSLRVIWCTRVSTSTQMNISHFLIVKVLTDIVRSASWWLVIDIVLFTECPMSHVITLFSYSSHQWITKLTCSIFFVAFVKDCKLFGKSKTCEIWQKRSLTSNSVQLISLMLGFLSRQKLGFLMPRALWR